MILKVGGGGGGRDPSDLAASGDIVQETAKWAEKMNILN
jgi:hypothetical protein